MSRQLKSALLTASAAAVVSAAAAWSAFAGPSQRGDAWQLMREGRQGQGGSRGMASTNPGQDPDPDYDRLDGKGYSGKKVDVVEWEGNLEIHVYPAGSLKGLALKVDKRNEDKPVMVIGYRFDNDPSKQLIRRAILGIELREPLKVYKDPAAQDYDKIVISNNGLASPLTAYRLDPEPRQLYPDGHPALAQSQGKGPAPLKYEPQARKPASAGRVRPGMIDPDDGTIQPFFTRKSDPADAGNTADE